MNKFNWQDYLADTSAEIAPDNIFDHVHRSHETIIKPCQFLLFKDSATSWSLAQVVIVTPAMLKICIYNDGKKTNIQKWLYLPKDKDKIKYIPDQLALELSSGQIKNFARVPKMFFKYFKLFIYECICPGYLFECEMADEPMKIWLVEVVQNQGGLLMLSWYGDKNRENRFILHYLNRRIHQLGYAATLKMSLTRPSTIQHSVMLPNNANLPSLESTEIKYGHPMYNISPMPHEFKVGWRLEAVHPSYPYYFQPAVVSHVIDEKYFIVKLDDMLDEKENRQANLNGKQLSFVAHSGMGTILPAHTSFTKGIWFKPPTGWPSDLKFTWSRYLLNYEYPGDEDKISRSLDSLMDWNPASEFSHKVNPCCPEDYYFKSAASRSNYLIESIEKDANLAVNPHFTSFISNQQNEFFLGMKIEFIHPLESLKGKSFPLIISGTVIRVRGRLLWVLPDHQDYSPSRSYISKDENHNSVFFIDSTSTEIFPLGWSLSVNYQPFQPPLFYVNPQKILSPCQFDYMNFYNASDLSSSQYSPKIYFNSKCYPGPYLKTMNLQKVPKTFGPGPLDKVIHSILFTIVKCSEKSLKILRLFEADWFSQISNNLSKSLDTSSNSSTSIPANNRGQPIFHDLVDSKLLNSVNESRQDKMDIILIRGRCAGKKSRVITPVEIPRKLCALEEYFKQICLLIEACPNLISVIPPKKRDSLEENCPCFCTNQIASKKYERVPNIRKRISQVSTFGPKQQQPQSQQSSNPAAGKKRSWMSYQSSCIYDLVPPLFQIIHTPKSHPVRTSSAKIHQPSRRITRNRLDRVSATKSRENSPLLMGPEEEKSEIRHPKLERLSTPLKAQNKLDSSLYIDLVSDDELTTGNSSPSIAGSSSPTVVGISLDSNPMNWSCEDIINYLRRTDCSDHLNWLKNQSIDGQAFLLLNKKLLNDIGLTDLQAERLMQHVFLVREAFVRQYGSTTRLSIPKL